VFWVQSPVPKKKKKKDNLSLGYTGRHNPASPKKQERERERQKERQKREEEGRGEEWRGGEGREGKGKGERKSLAWCNATYSGIPATQEAEIRNIEVQDQTLQKVNNTPISTNKKLDMHTCHPSYGRKHKQENHGPGQPRYKRETPIQKITKA
jgi:hypothetical protein